MKEAVTKIIDTLTHEDFYGAFQELFERYNKCIVAGGDYFEGEWSFICVLSIKVSIRKKSGNLLKEYIYIYIYIYIYKDGCCGSKERIRIYLKKRFVFFQFIYFVLTYVLYIYECFQLVAFVRKHVLHKAF